LNFRGARALQREERNKMAKLGRRHFEICCQNAAKLLEGGSAKLLRYLVDLIGIEPMTSSMP
jgi:hypothetical protein